MKTNILISILLLGFAASTFAQDAQIKGKVWDTSLNEPMALANVYVEYGDKIIGTTTDFEGRFTIKPLSPGTYNLTISAIGYQTATTEGVLVMNSKTTRLNGLAISTKSETMTEFVVDTYREPLINHGNPSEITMLGSQISKTPAAKSPVDAVRMMDSGIKKNEETGQLYFRGARPESMGYYTDGVKQNDQLRGVPGSSIGQLTVYVGGIPASYGDITGGVVVIETKSYFNLYNEWLAAKTKRDLKEKREAAELQPVAPVEQTIED